MNMEQIREVAMIYYTRSSAHEKKLARELFRALDGDGDGRVSLAEYKTVLGSNDHTNKLFDGIDKNGDGTLDFEEFLTFYFIIKVGIRSCDACGGFMPGSYFSCVLCEKEYPSTYDLCCACYGGGKFHHHHSADKFLDDRSMRLLLVHFLKKPDDQPAQPKLSAPVHQYNYSRSTTSRAEKVKMAFDAFDTVVNVGSAVGCIIM